MNRILSRGIINYNNCPITANVNSYKWYRTGNIEYAKGGQSTAETSKKNDELLTENVKDFDGSKISADTRKKLKPRTSIAKDFFIGKIDKDLIPYPEVIERDDMTKLYEETQSIKTYFKDILDVKQIEKTWCVSKQTIEDLKSLGCFGFNVPRNYFGKDYSISGSLITSECEQISLDISSILTSHRIIVDVINEFGTEIQKQKYLPKLAEGSLIATSAVYESTFSKDKLFNTHATYDDFENEWILNGDKSVVINGIDANLFLIIAQIEKTKISGEQGIGIASFLVDESIEGLKKSKEIQSFGSKGSKMCNLSFKNVKIPEECMLGTLSEADKVAQMLLKMNRLRTSLQAFNLMKRIINHMTQFCIENKQYEVSLQDMMMNSKRLSKAISSAYAIESMIYYTAGLMDEFDKPDVDVECAIIKLLSMETLWSAIKSSLEFLGPTSLLSGEFSETMLRNTAHLYTIGETIDSMHSFIGLSGIQHAGVNLYETVKKQRNPLFHPGHIINKFFEKNSIETPKINLNIGHELHPSLGIPAKWLEDSIGRLQICTDLLLTRHGTEIIKNQIDIRRLSKMTMYCYAMFASLSRSSRSYCIGLRHSDYEMLLSTIYCLRSRDIIKNLATDVVSGEYINNDRNYNRLSKQIYSSQGYFCEHPLKYNF